MISIRTKLFKVLALTSFLFSGQLTNAQVEYVWEWARAAGGKDVLCATYADPVVNNNREVIVFGEFVTDAESPMQFDGSEIELYANTPGVHAAFLAKYNDDGDVVWVTRLESGLISASSVVVDKEDNIYLTGYVFDYLEIEDIHLEPANPGMAFYFLIKLDTDGNLVWAKKMVERDLPTDDNPYTSATIDCITINLNNQIVIAGTFNQLTLVLGDLVLESEGVHDMYLALLDTEANPIWANVYGDPEMDDIPRHLVTDSKGNIYMISQMIEVDLVVNPMQTILTKVSPFGDLLWSDTINPMSYPFEYAYTVLAISQDDVLYTFSLYNGGFSIHGFELNPNHVLAIAKIDSDGNYLDINTFGNYEANSASYFPNSLIVDPSGNLTFSMTWLAGMTTPYPNFTLGDFTLAHNGKRDIILGRFNSDGDLVQIEHLGGEYADGIGGLVADGEDFYLAGYFTSHEMSFGDLILPNPSSTREIVGTNFFLAKWTPISAGNNDHNLPKTVFDVYPNPAQSSIEVSATDLVSRIEIIDALGRVVHTIDSENPTCQYRIDVSGLVNGNYLLRLTTSKGIGVKKFTIAK